MIVQQKKARQLKNLKVLAVALVDKGANGKEFALFKRKVDVAAATTATTPTATEPEFSFQLVVSDEMRKSIQTRESVELLLELTSEHFAAECGKVFGFDATLAKKGGSKHMLMSDLSTLRSVVTALSFPPMNPDGTMEFPEEERLEMERDLSIAWDRVMDGMRRHFDDFKSKAEELKTSKKTEEEWVAERVQEAMNTAVKVHQTVAPSVAPATPSASPVPAAAAPEEASATATVDLSEIRQMLEADAKEVVSTAKTLIREGLTLEEIRKTEQGQGR